MHYLVKGEFMEEVAAGKKPVLPIQSFKSTLDQNREAALAMRAMVVEH